MFNMIVLQVEFLLEQTLGLLYVSYFDAFPIDTKQQTEAQK